MAPNEVLREITSVVGSRGLNSVGNRFAKFNGSNSRKFYELPQVCIPVHSVRQREVVIDIEEAEAEMSSPENIHCGQPQTLLTPLEASMKANFLLRYPVDTAGNQHGVLQLAACLQHDNHWYPTTPQVQQAESTTKGYELFPDTPWLPSVLLKTCVPKSQKGDPVFSCSDPPNWPSQPFDFNNLKGGSGRGKQSNADTMSQLFENMHPLFRQSPESPCQWTAKDFKLTPTPRPQLTTDVVPYYIELLDGPQDWQPKLNPSDFRVTMIKPHGFCVSELTVRPEERGLSFLVASNQSDYHKLVVLFVAPGQKPEEIFGSPLNIRIVSPSPTPRAPPSLSFRQPVIDFKPWGFAEHRLKGLVYITEAYYNEIHVINLFGLHQFVIKLDPSITKGMCKPTGIAVCETNDRLYVTDKDNHRVLVLNWDGTYMAEFGGFGIGEGQFNFPWGIAVSSDGTLLAVADAKNKRVQFFSTATFQYINKYSVYDGNPSEYQNLLDLPGDLLFDQTGLHLYVSDFNIRAIIVINVSEMTQRFFTNPIFSRPQGMCWDLQGNLLVADMASGKVVALNGTGEPLDCPQSWKDIQTPLNVLQLQNGFVLALTERFGIVTLHDPRST